jgi:alanyl-tRNA synthetase
MNSKNVLNKIITLLSAEDKQSVELAFAELADGTVLESATFDVGEEVFVVGEDGSKTPAPDGEHELRLRDTEDVETRFKIFVTDGKITERENIELEEETEEVEALPETELSDAEEIKEEADVDVVNLEEVSKKVEEMAYRIDELEKKIAEMKEHEEEKEEMETEEEKEEVEMTAAPLNGAPKTMRPITNTRTRTASPQAAFLQKLYN